MKLPDRPVGHCRRSCGHTRQPGYDPHCCGAIAGMSLMPPASASPQIPPFVKSTVVAMMVFLAGLAIFGIFTSVGVLHLKNWARVPMLIWGAVMAAFSGLALPFAAFMPMPEAPAQSPVALPFVRTLLLIVYGIPFLIGVCGSCCSIRAPHRWLLESVPKKNHVDGKILKAGAS